MADLSLDSTEQAFSADDVHLLVVDDNPLAAGMLSVMLSKHGYMVKEVSSGEECLDVLDAFHPAVILMDIEMPGMDGYETCQNIRMLDNQQDVTVIFISAHDTLEERLRAYDVGGDDFVSKPFNAEELRRKIGVAVESRRQRRAVLEAKKSLEQTASMAMRSFSEAGAALRFARKTLACRSLSALAELIIEAMRFTDSECHVFLQGSEAAGTVTITPCGPATVLEESVLGAMRSHDRIFQFKSRMIVNYGSVSILVVNMPVGDETRSGNIRDYAAIIAEVAQDAVANVSLRIDVVAQAKELQRIAQAGCAGTERLQATIEAQQVESRRELLKMAETVEGMYYMLGLSDQQEAVISSTVRDTLEVVLDRFGQYGGEVVGQIAEIVDGLLNVSNIEIDMEENASPSDELWD